MTEVLQQPVAITITPEMIGVVVKVLRRCIGGETMDSCVYSQEAIAQEILEASHASSTTQKQISVGSNPRQPAE